MDEFFQFIQPFHPWFIFMAVVFVFSKLFSWAKNKKTGALVFCILTQMFMPDPYVERTIEVVQESKKESKQSESDESSEPEL